MAQEMTIEALSKAFRMQYGPDNTIYSTYSSEDALLVDLCIKFLNAGFHPTSVLDQEGIKQIKRITGVNLNNIVCTDASTPPSFITDQINAQAHTVVPPEQLIPKDSVCKHYSYESNVSDNYEFANHVNIATCSSTNVDGINCVCSFRQTICPFFSSDYALFSNYTVNQDGVDHLYKVFKYRTIDSNYKFTIYDSENNLLHELSYPIHVIKELASGLLEEEISSLVNEIHLKLSVNSSFVLDADYSINSSNDVPTKSYLATLIS